MARKIHSSDAYIYIGTRSQGTKENKRVHECQYLPLYDTTNFVTGDIINTYIENNS